MKQISPTSNSKSKNLFWPYLKVMRLDHYHKNIFVVVGMIAFYKLYPASMTMNTFLRLLGSIGLVCLASSFNYIINELKDAETDKFHPKKQYRPIPSGDVKVSILMIICAVLLTVTLYSSYVYFNSYFLGSLILFYLFAILYNVPPIRFKDVGYMDVMIESANNPIRFLLGWFAMGTIQIPPSSMLLSMWCLGCFLMTAKRYAEYRFIVDDQSRLNYRRSYQTYTLDGLSTFMVFWLVLFNFLFGIFIIRVEPATLITFPFVVVFLTWYWWLSHKQDSIVKEPERIFEEKKFFIYAVFLAVFFSVIFLWGDRIPFIEEIHHRYLFPR